MNYIGSKFKLSSWIKEEIHKVVGEDLSNKVFCDMFAGTGIIGRAFKTEVQKVIANDLEYYSFILNKNYIENHSTLRDAQHYLKKLNALTLKENGFIYTHYALGGGAKRQYFSDKNAQKIDTIRTSIEKWYKKEKISPSLYYFLLASLLESADKVANTTSVYGAFLKHLKKTAQQDFVLEGAYFQETTTTHSVYNEDANRLIAHISGDILYLDPPYKHREYGANYHILNTITKYKPFTPQGKTGLPDYNRSAYCNRHKVTQKFETLLAQANFKYIFLSYNNEGLMSKEEVQKVMQKYGKYTLRTKEYQRFKADNNKNRNHKAQSTYEYLHVLEKQ